MRAITQKTAGGPEVLVIAESPIPRPGRRGACPRQAPPASIRSMPPFVPAIIPLLGEPALHPSAGISREPSRRSGPGVERPRGRRRGVRHAALSQASGRLCRNGRSPQ